jgi:hypothetical protein
MDADIANVMRIMRELHAISERRSWPCAVIQLADTDEGSMAPFMLFTSPACRHTYDAHGPETTREMKLVVETIQGHQERAQAGLDKGLGEDLLAGLSGPSAEGEG